MATRSQKIKVGLFLTVTTGLFVILMAVIQGYRTVNYNEYTVYFQDSVLGLGVDGLVQYLGVPVGKVSDIYVDPKTNNAQVTLLIDPRKVELKEGVTGKLEIYSLATGAMCVGLYGGDPNGRPLQPGAVIPTETSVITSISNQIGPIVKSLQDIIDQVKSGMVGLEEGELAVMLEDVHAFVKQGSELVAEIETTVSEVKGSLTKSTDSFNELAKSTQEMVETTNLAIADVRKKIDTLELNEVEAKWREPYEKLAEQLSKTTENLDKSMQTIVYGTDNVEHTLIESIRVFNETLLAVRELADYLKNDPSSVLRGRADARSGGQ
ncbi:MAG: hypothetical protein AMXMBFR84_40490 [Candidatus Hydrogenedentota bacterium]